MKIRIFDPSGIKPDDYKHKYPELERTPEFSELSPKALIFVWWFANPTSDLVISIVDDYDRVEAALHRSGYFPGKTEKEKLLKLQFEPDIADAIKKMSTVDPGARFKGYQIIKTIFGHYQTIIEGGPDSFTDITGSGENAKSSVDYKRYVDTSAKIADTIPSLLTKLEEGFGVVDINGADVLDDDNATDIRNWHEKKKDNQE